MTDFGALMIWLTKPQVAIVDWMVYGFNDYILHFQDKLVPLNGSGDTSYGWVQVILYLTIATVGTVLWTALDYNRKNYRKLDYIIWTTMRYFICFIAFVYGSIKLFMMQMGFPSLSQLATPLGDYLPMRFTWAFIGYSDAYQFFSGLMEMVVFFLLLFRRTVTLGLFIGLGVFINVMMLNLCYDVPVKLFSIHLVIMCFLMLTPDLKRIFTFFIFNRPTHISSAYHFSSAKRWMRITRLILKIIFFALNAFVLYDTYEYYAMQDKKGFAEGVYDVQHYIVNNDTIPVLANDSLAWKDIIFDKWQVISVNTTDTILSRRYRRGYFYYARDSVKNTLTCFTYKKADSIYLFTAHYDFDGKDKLKLKTKIKGDSVIFDLVNNHRKFQLANKEFHWLSEGNR
ncbi:hypothetical protein [Flavobacterium sp. 3HN19-14]|uniref:hypothetical protein n=1 Tax=Flavobacterium sp. 3HN19-14 TaxID=3448133 RepID=UPI003EDF9122